MLLDLDLKSEASIRVDEAIFLKVFDLVKRAIYPTVEIGEVIGRLLFIILSLTEVAD